MSESSIDGAVVVTDKILPGRFVPYVVYMVTPKAGQDASGRVLAIINDVGPETPAGLVAAAVELDRIMSNTVRKNHGDDIVISFSPKRFDPNNSAHVALAREIVVETLRRGAPDSPGLAVIQGDNGVLHAHIPLANHDLGTGRARRSGWHHQYWRDINDSVLREHGIEPIVPGGAAVSEVERVAKARGLLVPDHDDLIAMDPTTITPREIDAVLAAHIAEAIIDERLTAVPEPGTASLVPIDADKALSVRCGTKGGLSYAVTDGDGSPLKTAPGKRGAKPTPIARSAGKLDRAHHTIADGDDKLFGPQWLTDQIAAMTTAEQEIDREREDEREREIARLEEAARREADRAAEYAGGVQAGTADGRDVADQGGGTADTGDFDFTDLDAEPDTDTGGPGRAGHGGEVGASEYGADGSGGSGEAGVRSAGARRERRVPAQPRPVDPAAERAAIEAMQLDIAVGDVASRLAAAASSRRSRSRTHTRQKGM